MMTDMLLTTMTMANISCKTTDQVDMDGHVLDVFCNQNKHKIGTLLTQLKRCGTVRSAHVYKGAMFLFTNSLFRFLFHFMFLQSLIVVS